MTIRFHLDENMPSAVAAGLRLRGLNVTTTHEAGLRTASDPLQLEHAFVEGRVIVTRDRDFLFLASSQLSHSGIIYWTEKRHFGNLILDLVALCEEQSAEEMVGRVAFL